MIYLIGPYTSSSVWEHRANIGRLYAYYVHLHREFPEKPIVCWPLMTAGLEQILPHLDHQWIEFCTNFIRSGEVTHCYVVPDYEGSSGCRIEIACTEGAGIPLKELPRPSWDLQHTLMMDMMLLRNRNEFARWAIQWLATL